MSGGGLLGGVGRSGKGVQVLAQHDAAFGAGGVRVRGYPRFWAKVGREVLLSAGKPGLITCWGWSASSPMEARGMAEARLASAVRPLAGAREYPSFVFPSTWSQYLENKGTVGTAPFDIPQGRGVPSLTERKNWLWGYSPKGLPGSPKGSVKLKTGMPAAGWRPEVEPILQEVAGPRGTCGVVTRNRYGARIMNATNAMFVDIDGQDKERLQAGLVEWSRENPKASLRVYETQNGLRVLRTDRLFDARSRETQDVLASMGSDEKYAVMCAAQDCFRARLTPKPWRCGVADAPSVLGAGLAIPPSWVQAYERASQEYGVCRYLGWLGPKMLMPEISPVLMLHDRYAIGGSVLA